MSRTTGPCKGHIRLHLSMPVSGINPFTNRIAVVDRFFIGIPVEPGISSPRPRQHPSLAEGQQSGSLDVLLQGMHQQHWPWSPVGEPQSFLSHNAHAVGGYTSFVTLRSK